VFLINSLLPDSQAQFRSSTCKLPSFTDLSFSLASRSNGCITASGEPLRFTSPCDSARRDHTIIPVAAISAASTSEKTPAKPVNRPNKAEFLVTVAQIPKPTEATLKKRAIIATDAEPSRDAVTLSGKGGLLSTISCRIQPKQFQSTRETSGRPGSIRRPPPKAQRKPDRRSEGLTNWIVSNSNPRGRRIFYFRENPGHPEPIQTLRPEDTGASKQTAAVKRFAPDGVEPKSNYPGSRVPSAPNLRATAL
jgi:hypothetical protein